MFYFWLKLPFKALLSETFLPVLGCGKARAWLNFAYESQWLDNSVFFGMNRFHEPDTVARSHYGDLHVRALIHAIQYKVNHGCNCVWSPF